MVNERLFIRLIGLLTATALLLVSCGTSSTSPASKASQGQVSTSPVPGYTAGLPPNIAKLYVHSGDILGPSAYRDWKPVKPPWTICFNNSYLGNTWRAAALQEFDKISQQLEKFGLVKNYISTNSNLSLPTQIQQMRTMITVDHCSGIITIPTGTSGMDSVIKQAYEAGIPVVGDLGPTTSPYMENYDENFYVSNYDMAMFLAKAIGYKGNILDVIGIPGETLDIEMQDALNAVVKQYPGLHIIGKVVGKVTDSIAEGAVLQFLATHPEPINAVFQEGGMGAGIIAAFQQEHRPLPALMFVGSGSMVAIFHNLLAEGQHPQFYALTDPPGSTMRDAYRILIRILEGQHPKNMTIFYPPPAITASNVNQWWNPSLTPSTTAWPEPPYEYLPDSLLNQYFTNGHNELPYDGKGYCVPLICGGS